MDLYYVGKSGGAACCCDSVKYVKLTDDNGVSLVFDNLDEEGISFSSDDSAVANVARLQRDGKLEVKRVDTYTEDSHRQMMSVMAKHSIATALMQSSAWIVGTSIVGFALMPQAWGTFASVILAFTASAVFGGRAVSLSADEELPNKKNSEKVETAYNNQAILFLLGILILVINICLIGYNR